MNPNLQGRSVASWLGEAEGVLQLLETHPDLTPAQRKGVNKALTALHGVMRDEADRDEFSNTDTGHTPGDLAEDLR